MPLAPGARLALLAAMAALAPAWAMRDTFDASGVLESGDAPEELGYDALKRLQLDAAKHMSEHEERVIKDMEEALQGGGSKDVEKKPPKVASLLEATRPTPGECSSPELGSACGARRTNNKRWGLWLKMDQCAGNCYETDNEDECGRPFEKMGDDGDDEMLCCQVLQCF